MREGLHVVGDGESGDADPAWAAGPTVVLTVAGQIRLAEGPLEVSRRYMAATTGGRSTIEANIVLDMGATRGSVVSVAHMIAWWRA